MPLFKQNNKKTEKKVKETKSTAPAVLVLSEDASCIVKPRITEKSGIQSETMNVYTFEVRKDATKGSIEKAIKELYSFTPLKVRIVNLPAKRVFARGKVGKKSGIKKAFVYLKKGDKIAFI